MPQYTTGDMAKLCEITVRTVQFYDARELLHPSELSEGGRRLYSDADLSRLRLICLLKSFGLSLDSIKDILESEAPSKVLKLLLDEQSRQLDMELSELQKRKKAINEVRESISDSELTTVNSISDIDIVMQGKQQLKAARKKLLTFGIIIDIAQLFGILLWIFKGIWWPFVVIMPFVLLSCALLVRMYYRATAYICPECGAKFKPTKRQFVFADHTTKTRKLTCTACGHTGWCVETFAEAE